MAIGNFRPAGGRDWGLLGLGAAGAALVCFLLLPRYAVVPTGYGLNFIKADRWTGSVYTCATTCHLVDDGPQPSE